MLEEVEVGGMKLYICFKARSDGDKHCICNYESAGYSPVGVFVKGDIGVVPARDVGFIKPVMLPSLFYHARYGRNNAIRFSSRITLFNSAGVQQGI